MKVSHSQQLEEMQRRHSSELREQRERMELEKQAWEENILKRQDTAMMTREREMKEQLRQERDKVNFFLIFISASNIYHVYSNRTQAKRIIYLCDFLVKIVTHSITIPCAKF